MGEKRTTAEYQAGLAALLRATLESHSVGSPITFKNCFGAVAGYVRKEIFIAHGQFGYALKLRPDTLATLFESEDVLPLRYFPKGHIKKEYAVLPSRILEDRETLLALIQESLDYIGR